MSVCFSDSSPLVCTSITWCVIGRYSYPSISIALASWCFWWCIFGALHCVCTVSFGLPLQCCLWLSGGLYVDVQSVDKVNRATAECWRWYTHQCWWGYCTSLRVGQGRWWGQRQFFLIFVHLCIEWFVKWMARAMHALNMLVSSAYVRASLLRWQDN